MLLWRNIDQVNWIGRRALSPTGMLVFSSACRDHSTGMNIATSMTNVRDMKGFGSKVYVLSKVSWLYHAKTEYSDSWACAWYEQDFNGMPTRSACECHNGSYSPLNCHIDHFCCVLFLTIFFRYDLAFGFPGVQQLRGKKETMEMMEKMGKMEKIRKMINHYPGHRALNSRLWMTQALHI